MRNATLVALLLTSACGPRASTAPAPAPSASGSAAPAPSASPGVAVAARAESRRDASALGDELLGSQRADERRAAARALARIGSPDSQRKLLRLLADEDAETLALAAYGLGQSCAADRDGVTRALVARAVGGAAGDRTAVAALARAIGRCATHDGEATLAAWTSGDEARAKAACLALGDVAESRKLAEESVVALTKAAAEHGEALFPFSRADQEGGVAARVRELAERQLTRPASPSRVFAIRALGRVGPEAAPRLGAVLVDAAFSVAERAEAARSLGRLGARGQDELAKALPSLLPGADPVSLTALGGASFGPLVTAVESIAHPPVAAAARQLDALVKLPLDDAMPTSLRRRVVRLRCEAAARLANDPGDPRVVACAPDAASEAQQLARLAVLARKPVKGKERAAILEALVRSGSARVRSSALELLTSHREIEGARELVAWGLAHEHAGTAAAAAQALATRPDIVVASVRPARRGGGGADPLAALSAALERAWGPDDTETIAALASAAGAVRLEAAKPRLQELCKSPWPTLRAHAERALVSLGARDATCSPVPHERAAAEVDAPPRGARVVLDTDAGELVLELDASAAPTAVARLRDLATAGFYDGMAVHRVVPGFVAQFGDRAGDGTGGAGKEPLRCETSPAPFEAMSVGVALAGRDTGSSQFFVTLSRVPHLDGQYALLGRASGDWSALAEGDVIRKASVAPR